MKCPVCGENAYIKQRYESKNNTLITRNYLCHSCETPFKTQEKVMFESLPYDVRQNYIMTGRLK